MFSKKKGASWTYDTPSCFMKTYYKFKTVENFYYDLPERDIFLLYPTQLVMPSVVAIAVKKLMAI